MTRLACNGIPCAVRICIASASIDDEFEPRRFLDRQVARRGASEKRAGRYPRNALP
jgi:hypothetical protein